MQHVKILSETTSVSNSTADWYRQSFTNVSGNSVTVTENSGQLPSNSAKIQVVRNGVIQTPVNDYSVVGSAVTFVEALDDETVIVTFLSDSESVSTLVDDIIPLEDAKAHLKVDYSDDDDLITMYIKAARQECERFLNFALVPKVLEEHLGCWPTAWDLNLYKSIQLSVGPLIAVDNIKYWDTESPSVQQTIENTDLTDNFIINDAIKPPIVTPISSYAFPNVSGRPYPISVQYQAGYSSTDKVPQPIKQAMLLLIGKMYENREDHVHKLPTAARYLLLNYRIPTFA